MRYVVICVSVLVLIGLLLAGPAAAEPGASPETAVDPNLAKDYVEALELKGQSDYDAVIARCEKMIQANPHFYRAYRLFVSAHRAMGTLDEASEYLEELARADSTNSCVYYGLAVVGHGRDRPREGLAHCKKSIQLGADFAAVYTGVADFSRILGELEQAMEYMTGFMESDSSNALAWFGIGLVHEFKREWDEGLENHEMALRLDPGLTEAHLSKARILAFTGEYSRALATYLTAAELAEADSDMGHLWVSLDGAGTCNMRLGNPTEAESYYMRAIATAEEIGDTRNTGNLLGNAAALQVMRGSYSEALEQVEKSYRVSMETGDLKAAGTWLSMMSGICSQLSQYPRALEYARRGVEIGYEIGDERVVMLNLANVAIAQGYMGNLEEALENNQRTLEVARRLGDRYVEQVTLVNIGVTLLERGRYSDALRYTREAYEVAKGMGDRVSMLQQLTNMGAIYEHMGDDLKALEYEESALLLAREMGDKRNEAVNLSNMGSSYWRLGNYAGALEHLTWALEIFTEIENQRNQARTLAYLGLVYLEQERHAEAVESLARALKIARAISDPLTEGLVLNSLGDSFLRLGQYEAAMDHYGEAKTIANSTGLPAILWSAQAGSAKCLAAQGLFEKAMAQYGQALDAIESVRRGIEIEESRWLFQERQVAVYREAVGLLIRMHRQDPSGGSVEEAFNYLERAKARAFLEILAESKTDVRQGVSPPLLEREKEILFNISGIQSELWSENLTEERRASLLQDLEEEESDLSDLKIELKLTSPAYAELTYPDPATLTHVQRETLVEGEVVLEYSLGADVSHVFAITKTAVEVFDLPPDEEIQEEVNQYLAVISEPPRPGASLDDLAGQVYDMLVRPLGKHVRPGMRLIVVPDGILHHLPFEALLTAGSERTSQMGEYLGEIHAVAYAPSCSVLDALRRRRSESVKRYELVAFGDPLFGEGRAEDDSLKLTQRGFLDEKGRNLRELPFSRSEVNRIGLLYPEDAVSVFVGPEATEECVKSLDLKQYSRIHFATHGLIDEVVPSRSCIVLTLDDDPAEDGFLQMPEIFNLSLDADLVVLSACQTGRGRLFRGEGLIGLSRAFFYAGASSMLISLWKVEDQSTALLMERFHTHLRDGLDRDEALRLAKIDLLNGETPALRHPYYWAPFILLGN